MSDDSDFRRAAARYRKAQEQLDAAREDLRTSMAAAREKGMTLTAMATTLGVSRQRAMRFLRGE